jgi:hypothetical protein
MSDNPPAERNPNPLGETTSPSSLELDQVIPPCQYRESSAQRDQNQNPNGNRLGFKELSSGQNPVVEYVQTLTIANHISQI